MYEESKRAGDVKNLNPLLRDELRCTAAAYPTLSGVTCDVVFRIERQRIWMETKLVQTHYGGNQEKWRFEDRNPMFPKHLGLIETRHHSAVRDVRDRLSTLDGHRDADRVAFLMVAYHSPRYPIDEHIASFERIGHLAGWAREVLIDQPDPRPRAQVERARISVYYWERATRAK
jgi:hypothetical protein